MPSINASIQQTPTQGVRAGMRPASPELNHKEPNLVSTIPEFLHSLRTPQLSDLPNDELDCGICHEPYLSGPAAEKAARLPCGHHFGIDCIRQWLEFSPEPKCPLCRRPILQQQNREEMNTLSVSINLLEQLVADPNSTARVLDEAQRETERRIAAARQRARRRGMNRDEDTDESRHDGDTAGVTAIQVLAQFRASVFADLCTSQLLEYHQWKRLAEQIEQVRQRVVSPLNPTESLWDERGPELRMLLNPVFRPLIEEFLQRMVQMERCSHPII